MRKVLAKACATVLVVSALTAGAVSADARCNGARGVQVWDLPDFQGASITWCAVNGAIDRSNLFFEGWNDRIGSFQAFNMPWNLPTSPDQFAG